MRWDWDATWGLGIALALTPLGAQGVAQVFACAAWCCCWEWLPESITRRQLKSSLAPHCCAAICREFACLLTLICFARFCPTLRHCVSLIWACVIRFWFGRNSIFHNLMRISLRVVVTGVCSVERACCHCRSQLARERERESETESLVSERTHTRTHTRHIYHYICHVRDNVISFSCRHKGDTLHLCVLLPLSLAPSPSTLPTAHVLVCLRV